MVYLINKQLLRKRFSKQAALYDQYAHVQKKMANRLLQKALHQTTIEVRNILEIGCGTGYVTKQLVKQFPHATITAIDLAPGMIEVAKKKCDAKAVAYLCADIEKMEISSKYDLVISNATFQWFNCFQETVHELCKSLTENGVLAFSTFGERTFYELHRSYEQALVQHELYKDERKIGQSFLSLETIERLLPTTLSYIDMEEEEIIEQFPNVRQFFQSVKKIGATNSSKGS